MDSYQTLLELLVRLIDTYRWIVDAQCIEFFSRDLWSKLPQSWQRSLQDVTYAELALLLQGKQSSRQIWPLSLLAFVEASRALSLPRDPVDVRRILNSVDGTSTPIAGIESVTHSFSRHVKPKKVHEIEHLGQLISCLCKKKQVNRVLDVGCGQGHLSRLLAFCYGFDVVGIEAVGSHLHAAQSLDQKTLIDRDKQEKRRLEAKETTTLKLKEQEFTGGNVTYIQYEISTTTDFGEFPHCLKRPPFCVTVPSVTAHTQSSDRTRSFVLTGLHTCGDLGATLVKLFSVSSEARLLVLVSCCYMKMENLAIRDETVGANQQSCSYPLSTSLHRLAGHHLSYRAKELACHTIDAYCQRLEVNDSTVRIHCYRASLQLLLVKKFPEHAHKNVRAIRNGGKVGIVEYVRKALKKIGLPEDLSPEDTQLVESLLMYEKQTVAFYCLRLLFGPVLETLLLIDRLVFLKEQGLSASVWALFDSHQSPRSHVIICSK